MVEKCTTGGSQLHAPRSAIEQGSSHFLFQVTNLALEARRRGMQLLPGRLREAAGFSNGHKVSQMAQLQNVLPCPPGMPPAYKVFFISGASAYLASTGRIRPYVPRHSKTCTI